MQVLPPSVECAASTGVVPSMRTQDWAWLSPSLTSLDTSTFNKNCITANLITDTASGSLSVFHRCKAAFTITFEKNTDGTCKLKQMKLCQTLVSFQSGARHQSLYWVCAVSGCNESVLKEINAVWFKETNTLWNKSITLEHYFIHSITLYERIMENASDHTLLCLCVSTEMGGRLFSIFFRFHIAVKLFCLSGMLSTQTRNKVVFCFTRVIICIYYQYPNEFSQLKACPETCWLKAKGLKLFADKLTKK